MPTPGGYQCLTCASHHHRWYRLLRVTADALTAHGISHASMVALTTKAGANGLSARQAELQRFLHDPDCTCLLLLMSNSSGAAGLNLTVATTAFILDPAPNPGLEAQAAARIYRLGQTKPTRLVSEDAGAVTAVIVPATVVLNLNNSTVCSGIDAGGKHAAIALCLLEHVANCCGRRMSALRPGTHPCQ